MPTIVGSNHGQVSQQQLTVSIVHLKCHSDCKSELDMWQFFPWLYLYYNIKFLKIYYDNGGKSDGFVGKHC